MGSFGILELILILAVLLFLFLPIGIIIFFLIRKSSKQSNTYKRCPFCAEMIKTGAIVCRFCSRDLVE